MWAIMYINRSLLFITEYNTVDNWIKRSLFSHFSMERRLDALQFKAIMKKVAVASQALVSISLDFA